MMRRITFCSYTWMILNQITDKGIEIYPEQEVFGGVGEER